MSTTRRTFLGSAALVPAMLRSSTEKSVAKNKYTYADIEKILASGDVKGKLSRADVPTPALLLDLDAFEWNIAKMTRHMKERGRALRPHGKTHKCPEIAHALIRAGAVGSCAAKLSEAEVFARHGVKGLLVTVPVIGRYKIERAVRLAAQQPDTIFSVDDPGNARDLNDAAAAFRGRAPLKLNLAIDLLLTSRTGIAPGEPALGLAQLITSLPHVRLAGLQAYDGMAAHVEGFENRKKRSQTTMGQAVETRRLFERKGIECSWISAGSTGTYNIDSEIEGVTEIQPGSFLFMDVEYNRIGGQDGPVYRDFKNSLSVLTTVISKRKGVAIVDGGFKAFSTDRPFPPEAKDVQGVPYYWAGDEHGRLDLSKSSFDPALGDQVEFIIPHCDPSVNLYDRIYGLRGEQVELVWSIAARGKSQ